MYFNTMTMSRQIEQQFLTIAKSVVQSPYSTLAKMTSVCILAALEFRSLILFGALLKIKIAGVVSSKLAMVNDVGLQSRSPEVIKEREIGGDGDKVDVTDSHHVRLTRYSGKGKKGGKKTGKPKAKGKGGSNEQADREKRQKEEEERLRKWNEDWDRKLKEQEALDDVPCCSAQGLFLKPRTQSNIWIKVTKDKNTQDVQMAFMHVPVPKPKAPALPKRVTIQVPTDVPKPVEDKKKKGKKKGKGKKK